MRCPICGRIPEECQCVDVCHRCMRPMRDCTCERSLRPELHDHQDDRFDPDEDMADDFRRDYQQEPAEDENAYAHGYNSARRQPRGLIRCPYTDATQRRSFYRGVSDARHRRYLG